MTGADGLHRLRSAPAPAKARITLQSDNGSKLMVAIGVIAIFLVVILGLNKFEFGRFD
jgi:hypothetical protein